MTAADWYGGCNALGPDVEKQPVFTQEKAAGRSMSFKQARLVGGLVFCFLHCGPLGPDMAMSPYQAATDSKLPAPRPAKKCPAAMNESGEVLFCVDFAKIYSLREPSLVGWNFREIANTDCWQIKDFMLQNKGLDELEFLCEASLPAIDLNDKNWSIYKTITLSMTYSVDLGKYQRAGLYLTQNDPRAGGWIKALDAQSAKTDINQHITLTINKYTIPDSFNGIFRPYLQTVSEYKGYAQNGWQVHSIALLGNN